MKKIVVVLFILIGCQSDESQTAVVLNQLTAKSWKVETATLNSAGGELSISNLANVNDDEFVFTASGSNGAQMNWQIRNQIRANATTPDQALLDYYLSAISSALTIQEDGLITTDEPNLKVKLISDNQLAVHYQMGSSEFRFNLSPAAETAFVPSTFDFEFITDIAGTAIGLEQAAGFTGSMASNSLYFAYKAFEGATSAEYPERVVRYDIDDGTFTTQNFINVDFVTKELHIINDELKVVGARFVNTYPLDLGSQPVSTPHNLTITRYGSTVVDDNVFLFGGDLNFPPGSPAGTGPNAQKIYRHDQVTGQNIEVGELPEPRYWAHGEIVDGKLYVFGGRQAFITETAEDDIFIHDMTTGENQTLTLPTPLHRTYAARYKHLIYVAGYREIPNADPALSTIETTFGVFDTHDNTFTVIPSSSVDFTGKKTIFGLTIVGNQLFILYGQWGSTTFSVYRTSLSES